MFEFLVRFLGKPLEPQLQTLSSTLSTDTVNFIVVLYYRDQDVPVLVVRKLEVVAYKDHGYVCTYW